MNESLIALSSIALAIFSAIIYTKLKTKVFFNLTGNIIVGVFGCIFFSKLVGTFGINPTKITIEEDTNHWLLLLYYLIAISGALLTLISVNKIANKSTVKD